MLYLAEVKKQKTRFIGYLKTELKLLAFQQKDQKWNILSVEQTIPAEEAKNFGDGTLVIVTLNNNLQIQATLEPAGRQIVRILQNFSAILEKSKDQEENIEQWKHSLTLQVYELNRREMEMKVRLEQIEQMEEKLKHLEQQLQKMQPTSSSQLLGTLLQQADLVSAVQIEVALKDQARYPNIRIGEILALRGWLKQETADFFAQHWKIIKEQKRQQPLGYYLKEAALLDEEQISQILAEQAKLSLRFGVLAVDKGWLKQTTVNFFLKHLLVEQQLYLPCTELDEIIPVSGTIR